MGNGKGDQTTPKMQRSLELRLEPDCETEQRCDLGELLKLGLRLVIAPMGMIICAPSINERIKYIKVENHLAKHLAHVKCYICYNNNNNNYY